MTTSATAASLLPDSPWIVLKFGGTSVAKRAGWENIAAIVRARRAEGARVLVVVSALSGVTDTLKSIVDAHSDTPQCAAAVAAIAARHRTAFTDLALDDSAALDADLARLAKLQDAPQRYAAPLAWAATVMAQGELLSSGLGAQFLNRLGLATVWLDARDYLRASTLANQNEWGRYLSAAVAARPDAEIAGRLAAQGEVFLTQGFIARNAAAETVVLGRGGSDTSAAYFGALLRAARVEIWTDVAGMFSANPRQVPGARLLNRLDYEEAQEIATTGAKVLHPRCLSPLREARVPLLIKDTQRPDLKGTEIGSESPGGAPSVKAISSRIGITLIAMETIGMWQQVGFLADVFEHFKRHGLSIDLIGSAETNVTVSLDPTENLLNSDVLEALCADLAKVCRVKVIAPCAAITLVGRGMRALLHRLSAVLAEFGQQRVHLLSQSSNNLNLTFVVDEAVAAGLLPRLHDQLIKAEAMRVDDQSVFGPSWHELYATSSRPPLALVWWRKRRQDLLALANEGTPRYVYDLGAVRAQAAALKALKAVDRWYYAVKANPHPALLRELAAQGFSLECVSLGEIEHVRDTLPLLAPNRILFTPNFAPRAEYAIASSLGAALTLDGLHPLAQWPGLFAGADIILRVDLGIGRGHHDKVKTGGSGSKFGLALDQLAEFRALADATSARIVGLHAHLGSGILDISHWRDVYAQLASLAEQIPSVTSLNIGGGLGVPARPDETRLDLDELGLALTEVKTAYPQYRLCMEPGRFLVADAGVLLARATQIKQKGENAYVGLDVGMNSLLRPALYEAYHEIVNLSRLDEPAHGLYQVVGPICESGDVLGSNRRLPQCQEGDVFLIAQAGAYGAVMASSYNLRVPAEEIVL